MMDMIRTIITEVEESAIKLFTGAGRPGEPFRRREVLQHYGFTSRPLAGAEGLVLRQGNTLYLIASDDRRYRLALEDGEVALYTDEGDCVHLKRGREIFVSSGGKVTVEAAETLQATAKQITAEATTSAAVKAPAIELTGPVTVKGTLTVQGNVAVTGNVAATGTVMDTGGNSNHHTH